MTSSACLCMDLFSDKLPQMQNSLFILANIKIKKKVSGRGENRTYALSDYRVNKFLNLLPTNGSFLVEFTSKSIGMPNYTKLVNLAKLKKKTNNALNVAVLRYRHMHTSRQ